MVLEGAATEQKAATHQIRAATLEMQVQKLEILVGDLVASDRKRFTRAVHRQVEKRMKHCTTLAPFEFPLEIKTETAYGEADVYIGTLTQKFVAISGDSDLIYQPSRRYVARPVKDGHSILFKVIQLIYYSYMIKKCC